MPETLIDDDDMIKECIVKILQESWTVLNNKLFEKLIILIMGAIGAVSKTRTGILNIWIILQ